MALIKNQAIRNAWRECWRERNFRLQFFITLGLIFALTQFFPSYFDYLENREGKMLNDALLNLIPPFEVSLFVFLSLYLGLFICFKSNITHPKLLILAFQTYAFVTILRVISLYFIHLNPPTGYIVLKEPLLGYFFTTNGKICSKDLFFSGHVSSILSIYFSVTEKKYKRILLACTVVIALMVLVQHVHYTIDVIAALPFTWICNRFSKNVLLKIK